MTVTAVTQERETQKRRGEDVGVPVRRLEQEYGDDIPDFWLRNNAYLSMYFTGFSAKLPEGEAQFIYSVRLFQDRITDPVLRSQVRAFIGQEAHHSREHDALNGAMKRRGYRLDKIERRMRRINKWMRKHQSPAKQLAGTVCGEHITALMADYFIAKRPDLLEELHPSMTRIWAWHAIEETEHKAVAFDVYGQLVGDRNLLRRTMLVFTLIFFTENAWDALAMTRRAGQLLNFRMWKQALGFLWRMMRELRSDYLDFYKKDYHPWQHDNRAALEAAKKRYFGDWA